MNKYTRNQQVNIENIVDKYVGGHRIFTPWLVQESKFNQFPNSGGTWALFFNLEEVFTAIYYKGIDPANITFFGDCLDKKTLVVGWGCKYEDYRVLLDAKLKKAFINMFDNSISNVPYNTREDSYTGDVDVSGGKMGTVGDKTLGRKLNKIQREITKPGGNIAQMGLKTGMLDEALSDPAWNPKVLSLMVDKEWWRYNTFWIFGTKEPNQNSYKVAGTDMDSVICGKIFGKDAFPYIIQQDSLKQLYEKEFITDTDNGNPLCMVRNNKKKDMKIVYAYPTAKGITKVVHGPKFTHYMAESAVTWLATDEPMLCDCAVIWPHATLDLANKQKIFTINNPVLRFIHKKMKIKGQDQFWFYTKFFDLNQIITGFEFPKEYNLTDTEKQYLNEKFSRN